MPQKIFRKQISGYLNLSLFGEFGKVLAPFFPIPH